MNEFKVVEIIQKAIRTRMNDIADTISTGGCGDWGVYKELCGVIQGLAYAERELLDLANTMKESNDN